MPTMNAFSDLIPRYRAAVERGDQGAVIDLFSEVPDDRLEEFLDAVEGIAPATPVTRDPVAYAAGFERRGLDRSDASWLASMMVDTFAGQLTAEMVAAGLDADALAEKVAADIVDPRTGTTVRPSRVSRYIARLASGEHDPRLVQPRAVDMIARALGSTTDSLRRLRDAFTPAPGSAGSGLPLAAAAHGESADGDATVAPAAGDFDDEVDLLFNGGGCDDADVG